MATFNAQLPSGGQLNPGDNVVSPNSRYSLNLQKDGNLVLLDVTAHELRNEMVRVAEMGLPWGLKKHCSR